MAMGGSTNTVLHALAIAHEAGVDYDLERINEISQHCPNICKVSPSSPYHIEDVDRAGGISAILKEIGADARACCTSTAPTVTGKTLGENIARRADRRTPTCIRPLDNAYSADGGLTILCGNLAPDGAVVKTAGVDPKMLKHEGPAIIFESQEDACEGILAGKVRPATWSSSATKGPRAAPACRRCSRPPATSWARAWAKASR